MEQDEDDLQVSKYSSGINIIKRLDILWRDTHAHSRAGQFFKWNSDLDRIWLELARDLKDKAKNENQNYEKVKEKFDGFDKNIEEVGNIKDNVEDGFQPLPENEIKKRSKHYKVLMEKQLFLARLENQLGKGTTMEDEDDDDI